MHVTLQQENAVFQILLSAMQLRYATAIENAQSNHSEENDDMLLSQQRLSVLCHDCSQN